MNPELPRGVVGVVRTARIDHAMTLARGWLAAGVPGVEVTTSVPDAPSVIAAVAAEGGGRVGAGTVRTVEQAAACAAAGAAYLVAPNFDRAVMDRARQLAAPMVPGTLTPSEMVTAVAAGAAAVKVFPASMVGGADYLTAVLEPLPDLRIVASGGIAVDDVPRYLEAGAHSVCLGRALIDEEAVERGDVDAVAEFAAAILGRCGIAAVTSAG